MSVLGIDLLGSEVEFERQFISPEHQRLYYEAKKMLDDECEREKAELEEARLDRLRPELAARKHAELMRDFDMRRRPFVKALTDLEALCPTTIIVRKKTT